MRVQSTLSQGPYDLCFYTLRGWEYQTLSFICSNQAAPGSCVAVCSNRPLLVQCGSCSQHFHKTCANRMKSPKPKRAKKAWKCEACFLSLKPKSSSSEVSLPDGTSSPSGLLLTSPATSSTSEQPCSSPSKHRKRPLDSSSSSLSVRLCDPEKSPPQLSSTPPAQLSSGGHSEKLHSAFSMKQSEATPSPRTFSPKTSSHRQSSRSHSPFLSENRPQGSRHSPKSHNSSLSVKSNSSPSQISIETISRSNNDISTPKIETQELSHVEVLTPFPESQKSNSSPFNCYSSKELSSVSTHDDSGLDIPLPDFVFVKKEASRDQTEQV